MPERKSEPNSNEKKLFFDEKLQQVLEENDLKSGDDAGAIIRALELSKFDTKSLFAAYIRLIRHEGLE